MCLVSKSSEAILELDTPFLPHLFFWPPLYYFLLSRPQFSPTPTTTSQGGGWLLQGWHRHSAVAKRWISRCWNLICILSNYNNNLDISILIKYFELNIDLRGASWSIAASSWSSSPKASSNTSSGLAILWCIRPSSSGTVSLSDKTFAHLIESVLASKASDRS